MLAGHKKTVFRRISGFDQWCRWDTYPEFRLWLCEACTQDIKTWSIATSVLHVLWTSSLAHGCSRGFCCVFWESRSISRKAQKNIKAAAHRSWFHKGISFVLNAGTPLVSDPGKRLVKAAIEEGIRVIPIPGPSAVLTALSVSGLPAEKFTFCGFLPPKSNARLAILGGLKGTLYQRYVQVIEKKNAPKIQCSISDHDLWTRLLPVPNLKEI